MLTLRLHKIFWCAQHGHPVLALHIDGHRDCLVVALGNEDALALAAVRVAESATVSRPFALLVSIVQELGARLVALQFRAGADATLQAFLHLDGPRGAQIVPAHLVDGLTLALRHHLPLWMTEGDVASFFEATGKSQSKEVSFALEPYRSVIESLDLEGFGPPGA